MTINNLGDAIDTIIPQNEQVVIYSINKESMRYEEEWNGTAYYIPEKYKRCEKWCISNFYKPFDVNYKYAYQINIVIEE